jgi:PAS domain S-box-containing protein
MALVGRDRRYTQVNDAAIELYKYRREDVIGQPAGHTVVGEDPEEADAQWEQLLSTNELYGERVISDGSGKLLHISFAAHGSTASGRWQVLFVTLSAHLQAGDAELIGALDAEEARAFAPSLTPREREVVRRVALGASTRRIAADLYLSPATVRSHVRNAMVKTNAHTRAQLVAIVLGDGLISE